MESTNFKDKYKLPLKLREQITDNGEITELKIVLLEEGSAILNFGQRSGVFSAPAVLCLNDKESINVLKSENLKVKVICFNPYVVNDHYNTENIYGDLSGLPEIVKLDHFYFIPFINRTQQYSGYLDIGPISAKRLSGVFNALKEQYERLDDLFWPCRCRSYLIEILFLVQHLYSESELSIPGLKDTDSDINEILLYLHLNYQRKITIEELTTEFHTNRNSLNKKFKTQTGLPVMEYIIQLRIRMGCVLLRDTSLPVSEIMQRVGFFDTSHWGRAFKKVTGMTPKAYRERKII